MYALPITHQVEVTGILLRYAILLVMDGVTTPASVDDIAGAIQRLGVRAPERQGKWISDALRTEVRKGRVIRTGRDRYVAGVPMPNRTRSRARSAITEARRTGVGNKGRWSRDRDRGVG